MSLATRCSAVQPQALPKAQPRRPPVAGMAPCRRRAFLLAAPAAAWALWQQPAGASENAGGVDSSTSPLIQELLRRTEEKKEERKRERLEDYYRRNFEDYLSFQASSEPGGGSENQQRIRAWLERKPAEAAAAQAAVEGAP